MADSWVCTVVNKWMDWGDKKKTPINNQTNKQNKQTKQTNERTCFTTFSNTTDAPQSSFDKLRSVKKCGSNMFSSVRHTFSVETNIQEKTEKGNLKTLRQSSNQDHLPSSTFCMLKINIAVKCSWE